MDFVFSGVSAIFRFLVLLLLVFSSFSAVLLFVVYVNKLVGLLLLTVKAYVFFVTGLLFSVGVGILSELSLLISMLCELNIIAEKC